MIKTGPFPFHRRPFLALTALGSAAPGRLPMPNGMVLVAIDGPADGRPFRRLARCAVITDILRAAGC